MLNNKIIQIFAKIIYLHSATIIIKYKCGIVNIFVYFISKLVKATKIYFIRRKAMKKKLLLISLMVALFICVFAISASAANNIIKLSEAPTFDEIHANPDAYVSHLDAFDGNSYGELDSKSVVVLSDLAETPTYYVFPSYYYVQSTSNNVYSHLPMLNSAISAADSSAFAGYAANSSDWGQGGCKYLIRFEVPTYVTTLSGKAKFEGSSNLIEVYFPTKTVIDEETGLEKTVSCITSISGENLFSSCTKLEYVHNSEYLPAGIVAGNKDGFAACKSLKEIKIPETATYMSFGCFSECSALTEVTLPNSLASIDKMAFGNCTNLVTVRFGASFYKFTSPNNDFETFLNASKLKYVYLPDNNYSFVGHATLAKNIFNQGKNVTFFFTGNAEKAQALKDLFAARTANDNISKAELVAFDPTINYEGYADSLGKNLIVYDYSECDAFYKGVHSYEANPCVEICSVCNDIKALENPKHNLTTEISYEKLTLAGTKHVYCSNAGCAKDETFEAPILFEFVGYSTNKDNTELCVGYTANIKAIEEYNLYNETDILFGVVATIIDEGEDLSLSYDNGSVTANLANTVIAPIDSTYSGFDFKLSGFKDFEEGDTINLKALNLVMSAYAYDGDFYFIGNADAKDYCEKEASTITFEQIQNKTN